MVDAYHCDEEVEGGRASRFFLLSAYIWREGADYLFPLCQNSGFWPKILFLSVLHQIREQFGGGKKKPN